MLGHIDIIAGCRSFGAPYLPIGTGRIRQTPVVTRYFHVTSTLNRASIYAHGLDWTRMGAACGIAGSRSPEQAGCFLCLDDFEIEIFIRINNTGGPVDVWEISGVDPTELVSPRDGYGYLPRPVAPEHVSLVRRDIAPSDPHA